MNLVEVAYFTSNLPQMREYYRALLGRDPVAASEGMAIFLVGRTKIFIHQTYTPAEGDLPAEDHLAFAVDDVDTVCRSLSAKRLSLEVAPADYYWGRSAYLRDPDGHLIELTQEEPS